MGGEEFFKDKILLLSIIAHSIGASKDFLKVSLIDLCLQNMSRTGGGFEQANLQKFKCPGGCLVEMMKLFKLIGIVVLITIRKIYWCSITNAVL